MQRHNARADLACARYVTEEGSAVLGMAGSRGWGGGGGGGRACTCRFVGVPGRSSGVRCIRGKLKTASRTRSLFTGLQLPTVHHKVTTYSYWYQQTDNRTVQYPMGAGEGRGRRAAIMRSVAT